MIKIKIGRSYYHYMTNELIFDEFDHPLYIRPDDIRSMQGHDNYTSFQNRNGYVFETKMKPEEILQLIKDYKNEENSTA